MVKCGRRARGQAGVAAQDIVGEAGVALGVLSLLCLHPDCELACDIGHKGLMPYVALCPMSDIAYQYAKTNN